MELDALLSVVAARKWLIVATTAAAVAIAAGLWSLSPTEYTASTTLQVVSPTALSDQRVTSDDLAYIDRLTNTYAKLATSKPLVTELMRRAQLRKRPTVTVSFEPNTELMKVNVTTQERSEVVRAANAMGALLIETLRQREQERGAALDAQYDQGIAELVAQLGAEQRQYVGLAATAPADEQAAARVLALKQKIAADEARLEEQQRQYADDQLARLRRENIMSIAVPAVLPRHPSGHGLPFVAVVSGVVGLLAGLGLAFAAEKIRRRVYLIGEVEAALGATAAGEIPRIEGSTAGLVDRGSAAERAFRRAWAAIGARNGRPPTTLVITSVDVGDGKSTVVANLACAAARSGCNVVVVDGNLRSSPPTQSTIFGLQESLGLADVLLRSVPLYSTVQKTGTDGLFVIPVGSADVSVAVEADRVAEVIAELEEQFDLVLFDSPALLAGGEAITLAQAGAAVLLVIRPRRTRARAIQEAGEELEAADAHVVGVLINASRSAWKTPPAAGRRESAAR